MGKPTSEQLAKINQLARVPLTEEEAYTFQAKLVGDKVIPRRFSRITPNFLRKMADQAKQGVSLLLDHSWANLGIMTIPLGRTYDSRLQQEGDEYALYADHYMKLGQELNGIKVDQLADGIDAGTIFDTSIGFYTTKHNCSICNEGYFSGKCEHFRGMVYEGVTCIVEMDDGGLMENSLVFDGAYPGAGVVGLSNIDNVELTTEWEQLSEDTKSLNGDERVFYSFSNKSGLVGYVPRQQNNIEDKKLSKGDGNVTEEQKAAALAAQQSQIALTTATGLLGQIRTALSVESDADILAKLSVINDQAEDGRTFKLKIVDEACGAGVRALGEAFNVEVMKLSLNGLSAGEVEKIRDSYNAQAQVILGGGGQHTQGSKVELPSGALSGNAPGNPQDNGDNQTPEQLRAAAREEARTALKNTGHGNLMKEDK
ncbi:hypothetical protein [Paenibacillus endoradicis]|uniref:hypothetical protein n=1 Tax=Paenibacillus endoradicis TaxID=2972487 RepID=UPI00215960F0|nr:hypothetical protein [Paenibacillus endoradicis]MCR8656940.1 hypothetical protein [Paenibacillus endoradicis]